MPDRPCLYPSRLCIASINLIIKHSGIYGNGEKKAEPLFFQKLPLPNRRIEMTYENPIQRCQWDAKTKVYFEHVKECVHGFFF